MIVFIREIDSQLNWVHNNNILQYKDDTATVVFYSDISFDSVFLARIFPDPNLEFRINLKEYLKAIINTKHFQDTVIPSIGSSAASLIKNDTEGNYKEIEVSVSVVTESYSANDTKTYKFLNGIEFLDRYKLQETLRKKWNVMSPTMSRTDTKHRINYWPGYPLDIAIYLDQPKTLRFRNEKSFIHMDLNLEHVVNRVFFCDGSHDQTIETHLPLSFGHNNISIFNPAFDAEGDYIIELDVIKHHPTCGAYIKFRNQYGAWSYWLFHKKSIKERSVSEGEEIDNDTANLPDTISPVVQTGISSSKDLLKLYTDNLDNEDVRLLEYLIESPKVYLYFGDRFSQGSDSKKLSYYLARWTEVKVATRKLQVEKVGTRKYKFNVDIELPPRGKVSLL